MSAFEALLLLMTGAVAWFWVDALNARESALAAVRALCRAEGLQLLDFTVAAVRLRPARDADGRLRLQRVYQFDYSDTGDNRRRGSVVLLGRQVLVINAGLRLVSSDRTLH